MPIYEDDRTREDLRLLRDARGGRWEAFAELVGRLEPLVLAVAYRIVQQRQDAEDVAQQTFLSAMENLDGFREQSSVSTWIRRIATNHALALLRKRRVRSALSLDRGISDQDGDGAAVPHPEFIAHWRDNPSALAERAEVRQLLDQALADLEEKYRLVFVLRDVEEFSTREAAELLGISESNVKVRLLRARLQLRERLTQTLGDESTRVAPHHDDEVDP